MNENSLKAIRQKFLDFFSSKGHEIVSSSAIVPKNDPSLMFTNSGMVQFKEVLLGNEQRDYVRAASVQMCLRAGGKHNDLESVGYTARHHTFFEMLGSWSFGDYFKRDSLLWGWELLTEVYQIPKESLLATVYEDDCEAYEIWRDVIGLPEDRIIKIGDNKGGKYKSDNFWTMADVGPCGPCSEIFYDHGPSVEGGPPGSPNENGDRFVEIWNHVFMQYDMQADGSLVKLPKPCVDTGMGLERLAAVLQKVHSNYEVDVFKGLITSIAKEVEAKNVTDKGLRVIADHLRAAAFLIAEGVIPGNEGRNYVLRKLIRRAVRHGYKLGLRTPFFSRTAKHLVREMGDEYATLSANQKAIESVLLKEEIGFFETLSSGMKVLESALKKEGDVLSGQVAFKLHDTYGMPLDVTVDVCTEAGVSVDLERFHEEMSLQKKMSRGDQKEVFFSGGKGDETKFVGREVSVHPTRVTSLYKNGTPVDSLCQGEEGVVCLSETPFYAESGGQAGDGGVLYEAMAGAAGSVLPHVFNVKVSKKINGSEVGHFGVACAQLTVGDLVVASIDQTKRDSHSRNHSATHLLHSALRKMFGDHVKQKGSSVSANRLRFDFSHPVPISDVEVAELERLVNEEITKNTRVETEIMTIDEAVRNGVIMLECEKYEETVRVVGIGQSKELCGGTHVSETSKVGHFRITKKSGVSSGVRRIEATTEMPG
jgi:alanyl-tRNA synthetase